MAAASAELSDGNKEGGIFLIDRKLIFENGSCFLGKGFGADVDAVHEVVFNTSVVGYQEIFSDLSYHGQLVCMTYPLIGNYGTREEDYEAKKPSIGGLIVREYNGDLPSLGSCKTLSEQLKELEIPGIYNVDTRQITRMIREKGSQRALLTCAKTTVEDGINTLKSTPLLRNHVTAVSCAKPWHSDTANPEYNVVIVDCGVKLNIFHTLVAKNCKVTVVPYDTSIEELFRFSPDGVLISNGPGDPQDNAEVIRLIQQLQGKLPIFGICLGHQLLALANGARTFKMKFGHRGGNHPVKELPTGRITITSQNHSFAVDTESLKGTGITPTHINLLDGTAEGLEIAEDKAFSVQYHPEGSPGPQDNIYLFDRFISFMSKHKQKP
ncbi:MAG: glutamine-hydrolyzing carbamoyl-phosphate synthase small subunit [Oscillospiraceae bacterium]|jgi:carbamoyl-phosphate synthase small subunit|nr:glutamine-hydrolyzing carbamoyl-phosphate synthase small subunit [Oscillospiraceae bacterium]